ncbi:hypothetical protein M1373_03275 [Candidatus Marsarchaeota archaeon]|nr:hypothetical protein [Candidatus Marsarchaeota archaeon]MCL5404768.1 hypothetical protein [Candidatus Marsarchaeota archaeon]
MISLASIPDTLRRIYKPRYIALNVVVFALYYVIMQNIILLNSHIVLFNGVISEYAFYALAVTSSMLITIAIYGIANSRIKRASVPAPIFGSITAFAGSAAVSCGCSFSLIFNLAVIGLSSSELISLNTFIAAYETPILLLAVFINFVLIIYYAGNVRRQCFMKPKSTRSKRKK